MPPTITNDPFVTTAASTYIFTTTAVDVIWPEWVITPDATTCTDFIYVATVPADIKDTIVTTDLATRKLTISEANNALAAKAGVYTITVQGA